MTLTNKKKWWILFVTTSGTSLVFLDNTVMPVALPSVQRELLFSPIGLVWVVNAYLLSLTSLLLIGGRLSDIFGKRSLFIWGLSLFGLGSLIAAFSYCQWVMILGRVIQGFGGALTIPTTVALLISTFGKGERAKAIGINTGISSIFLILGPPVGGFLTQYISWRSIFFLNIPLVIFGIVMAVLILSPGKRKNETFHFSGALIMLLGVISLVVGLMQANEWGWTSPLTLTFIVIGPVFIAIFVQISMHIEHPIIDFRLFRNHLFATANILIFLTQVIVMMTVLWAIYFQEQLNYSPIQTGLLIFIAAFPVFMMAPLGGYIADRIGPRIPILSGFALLCFSLVWLMYTVGAHRIIVLLPGLLSFGCGMPMIMSPTVALALSQSQPEKLGAASGISTSARQLASTTGIALLTAVYHGRVEVTGLQTSGFFAICFVAIFFALFGFVISFFLIREKNGRRKTQHLRSHH